MAIKSKDEILTTLNEIVGDSTTDEVLSFIEDITDTFDNVENSSQTDWEQKYKENDEMWRKKYKERFYSAPKEKEEDEEDEEVKNYSYDNLFKGD